MPIWLQIIIIMCVGAGVGLAAFGIWAAFKLKLSESGESMAKLRDTVAGHEKALQAAERRFRSLEAIVTSKDWDALDRGVPSSDTALPQKQPTVIEGGIDLNSSLESSDAERVSQIARRTRS